MDTEGAENRLGSMASHLVIPSKQTTFLRAAVTEFATQQGSRGRVGQRMRSLQPHRRAAVEVSDRTPELGQEMPQGGAGPLNFTA